MPNKYYVYFLNAEPHNFLFLTFMDQYGIPIEVEDKVNLTLLINKYKKHTL